VKTTSTLPISLRLKGLTLMNTLIFSS